MSFIVPRPLPKASAVEADVLLTSLMQYPSDAEARFAGSVESAAP
jgi:hypothetical protein